MPAFLSLETEAVVRIGDRTRLDASKSFLTPDIGEIMKVEIEPFAGFGFIDLALDNPTDKSTWFLDWQFSAAGAAVPSVRVTDAGSTTYSGSGSLDVVDPSSDVVFASDQDLVALYPDVLKYTRNGRNTFLDVHREVVKQIVDWVDQKGFVRSDGSKFQAVDFVDITEVRQWAIYAALRIIFDGLSNAVDDIFDKKMQVYRGKENEVRQRAILRLDLDQDGEVDETNAEGINISTGTMYRR